MLQNNTIAIALITDKNYTMPIDDVIASIKAKREKHHSFMDILRSVYVKN